MSLTIWQVDAFTDTPFSGNPAAVCTLRAPRDEGWMQQVAREMNLSETAFLAPREDDGFDLRWFTPAVEVDLCGHATLASAHVLWETGAVPAAEAARFHTRSGVLTATRRDGQIEMDFPAERAQAIGPPPGLVRALAMTPAWTGETRFDYLAEVESEQAVREMQPDMGLLEALPVRGIIVTAPAATPGFDFVSRFFAPAVGIPEDPVTGSAHCTLGPFWSERLGKEDLLGYQASARGGVVGVRLAGERVLLSGHAVTVLRCELLAEG